MSSLQKHQQQLPHGLSWKSHISDKFQLPGDMYSWLCFEKLKLPEEATQYDDVSSFVTHSGQLKGQGPCFNPKRLQSGQITTVYCIEINLDGPQIYKAKDANRVRVCFYYHHHHCPGFVLFLCRDFLEMFGH